jgi:cytoskeletal protein CcmA (bactofilin family)
VGATNTLTLPAGSNSTLVSESHTQTLTNKSLTAPTITGTAVMADLDISGDVDVDGTLEADAVTVNGTALNTVIAGVTVTNATNSAHVLVTDNESTDEENLITFVEDATSSTGNVGLEMDGNLTYNPSSGTVTATVFKGNIDAVDGDFDGTLEADAITLNGTAVTTTATLSTGISNGNVLVATSGIADNDFLRVDGTSIEGRSASEVLSDIGATTASAAADEATALAIALG